MSGSANVQGGSANVQGKWWGRRAEDWSSLQEFTAMPLYRTALEKLGSREGMRVLDVGCGAGLFCQLAAGRGAAVEGLDASEPFDRDREAPHARGPVPRRRHGYPALRGRVLRRRHGIPFVPTRRRSAAGPGGCRACRAIVYADLESALRGTLSAGPAARAIDQSGEEPVRRAVAEALAPFRLASGGYRLENRSRYLVAEAA